MNAEQRYVVTAIGGYDGNPRGRYTVDFAVHDSWHGYAIVGAFPARRARRVDRRRFKAEALCRQLNADHERWLRERVA